MSAFEQWGVAPSDGGGIPTYATEADLSSLSPETGDRAVVETPPSLWEYDGAEWVMLSPPDIQLGGGYSSTPPTVIPGLVTSPQQYTSGTSEPALGAAYSTTPWSP